LGFGAGLGAGTSLDRPMSIMFKEVLKLK